MTRINVVPVQELCDKHLLAEFRELTRIPNAVARGRFSMDGQPKEYILGTGHVKFFYDKMKFLHMRYIELLTECLYRGFKVKSIWPDDLLGCNIWNDYKLTQYAIDINRNRITDRMPNNAKWTKRTPPNYFV